MLMVLKPEKEKEAAAIFRKWGLDFAGWARPRQRSALSCAMGRRDADLPIKNWRPGAGIQAALRDPAKPKEIDAERGAPVDTARR
jgi:hypothetical protein